MKPNREGTIRQRPGTAIRAAVLLGALLAGAATATSTRADNAPAGAPAAEIGHEAGSTMRNIGIGAREAGRTVGHTVRDAAVVTWYHVRETGRTVGRTARDGSRAFIRGLKGEPER